MAYTTRSKTAKSRAAVQELLNVNLKNIEATQKMIEKEKAKLQALRMKLCENRRKLKKNLKKAVNK